MGIKRCIRLVETPATLLIISGDSTRPKINTSDRQKLKKKGQQICEKKALTRILNRFLLWMTKGVGTSWKCWIRTILCRRICKTYKCKTFTRRWPFNCRPLLLKSISAQLQWTAGQARPTPVIWPLRCTSLTKSSSWDRQCCQRSHFYVQQTILLITSHHHCAQNWLTIIKACELLEKRHLPCYAHCLNLVVQDSLSIKSIQTILTKCKRILTFFRCSTIAYEMFKKAHGVHKPYRLIQQVCTRWNSAFKIERILLTKEYISPVLLSLSKAPEPLAADDVAVLEDLKDVLASFDEVTNQLSLRNTYIEWTRAEFLRKKRAVRNNRSRRTEDTFNWEVFS